MNTSVVCMAVSSAVFLVSFWNRDDLPADVVRAPQLVDQRHHFRPAKQLGHLVQHHVAGAFGLERHLLDHVADEERQGLDLALHEEQGYILAD